MTASAAAIGSSTVALPAGIRSCVVNNINGLAIHMLEAGFEINGRPLILLLHGFPELAYSWRKIMGPLAAAGYHVVAPDQRGYGRTTGWDGAYDGDLDSFRLPNLVRDALGLVSALGYRSVAAVVGHDFGSPVAAYCALIRADMFRSVALMSAPLAARRNCRLTLPRSLHRPLRLTPQAFSRTWRGLILRGSIANATTKRAKPTTTCGELRRVSTLSCAPIIITRVLTGRGTSHSSWALSRPARWRKCRPITSWISTKGCRRRPPNTCHLRRRSLPVDGSLANNCPFTQANLLEPDFRAACNGIGA